MHKKNSKLTYKQLLKKLEKTEEKLKRADNVCREVRAAIGDIAINADWSRVVPFLLKWMQNRPKKLIYSRPE